MVKNESKFDKFINYLIYMRKKTTTLTLSFDKIEEIGQFKLPESAFRYTAYWNWKSSPTHRLPNLIKDAGFPEIDVDLDNCIVRLSKN